MVCSSTRNCVIYSNETIIATKILLQQISNQNIIVIRFITHPNSFSSKQRVWPWRLSEEPSILDEKKIGTPTKELWSSVPKEGDITSSLNDFGTVKKNPPSLQKIPSQKIWLYDCLTLISINTGLITWKHFEINGHGYSHDIACRSQ